MVPITLYYADHLLPHLERVPNTHPPQYEVVIRYVGALQMYVTLPSKEEVVIDYSCAEVDRMTVFTLRKLYLDTKGSVVQLFTDPA